MNSLFVKLAAAAVIAIAAIIGVTVLNKEAPTQAPVASIQLDGPLTHTFDDGSIVTLAAGASVRTYAQPGKRGFEHLAGQIEVTVAKGKGEFIVTTPHGDVKALGTEFTLDLISGVTADTNQPVDLLSVEVTEGKVEVSNDKGRQYLEAEQDGIIAKDDAPYDFNQDEALPDRLKERIQAMVDAFASGDRAAWAANFNMDYVFKLAKGQVEYDPLRFGGSKEDAERLGQMAADFDSAEDMLKAFIGSVNITEPVTIYVRAVELSNNGNHARAECFRRKSANHIVITRPQWHNFDEDWWQIDD
jgi:hypothetical protein